MAFFLQTANIIYKSFTTQLNERTANNKLYLFVKKMEPSLFVVNPWGKPALDYYKMILSDLNKHQYIDGKNDKKSKLILNTSSKERYEKSIDDVFEEINENNFYFYFFKINKNLNYITIFISISIYLLVYSYTI